MILVNVKRVERWSNKVIDISDLTKDMQPSASMRKREPHTLKKTETKPQHEVKEWLEWKQWSYVHSEIFSNMYGIGHLL
jgi:hypothetical protein